jgi:predicted nucleic acid-binding OB-fold protein
LSYALLLFMDLMSLCGHHNSGNSVSNLNSTIFYHTLNATSINNLYAVVQNIIQQNGQTD